MDPVANLRAFAARSTSPLQAATALGLSTSEATARTVTAAPRGRRGPGAVLAAVHHLALAGLAPDLARAYAGGDTELAAHAAPQVLRDNPEAFLAVLTRHTPRTLSTDRCAVLHPAIAEIAHRAGAAAVGLIDLTPSTGIDLHVDRVGIDYGDATFRGWESSPLQLRARIARGPTVPDHAFPDVVARIGLETAPTGLSDPEEVRWLHACLPPDRPEAHSRLDAELRTALDRRTVLTGDPLDLLDEAVAAVPEHALPVVTTSWVLSQRTPEDRLRFLRRLDAAATRRTVAWVSLEGVGVAPGVPTLGDRPASGHSLIGLTLCEHASLRAEVVGRCWSRGRVLAWSVDG